MKKFIIPTVAAAAAILSVSPAIAAGTGGSVSGTASATAAPSATTANSSTVAPPTSGSVAPTAAPLPPNGAAQPYTGSPAIGNAGPGTTLSTTNSLASGNIGITAGINSRANTTSTNPDNQNTSLTGTTTGTAGTTNSATGATADIPAGTAGTAGTIRSDGTAAVNTDLNNGSAKGTGGTAYSTPNTNTTGIVQYRLKDGRVLVSENNTLTLMSNGQSRTVTSGSFITSTGQTLQVRNGVLVTAASATTTAGQ